MYFSAKINENEMSQYVIYRERYSKQLTGRKKFGIGMKEADRFMNERSYRLSMLGYIKKKTYCTDESLQLLREAINEGDTESFTFFDYFDCSRMMCDWTCYAENFRVLSSTIRTQLNSNEL